MDSKNSFSPEENGEEPKKSGIKRETFVAAAAGALLLIVLACVFIFVRCGRDGGGESSEQPAESSYAEPSEDSTVSAPSSIGTLTAPDLVGQMWDEELAKRINPIQPAVIYDNNSTAPKGQITAQHPPAGTTLYCDDDGVCRSVEITVSGREFSTAYTSLVGSEVEDAFLWLEECGIKKENVLRVYKASTTGVGNGCISAFTYDNGGEVAEGTVLKATDKFTMTINSYTDSVTVPPLGGKSFEEAVELLFACRLNVGEISYRESGFADGTVLSQTPAEDVTAYYGDKVDLVLSTLAGGFEMPSLTGLTVEEADAKLAELGLTLGTVKEESTREYPLGTVFGQSVPEKETVYADTVIDVTVAAGGAADESADWGAEAVELDISESTHLSAGTLEAIAALGDRKAYAVCGDSYIWTLPSGAVYPEGDEGLELAVTINGGKGAEAAMKALEDAGYETGSFVLIVRESEQEIPQGVELGVNLGADFSGGSVKLLKYDAESGSFAEVGDEPYPVTENGYASFEISGKGIYAAVLAEGDESSAEETAAEGSAAADSSEG